MIRILVIGGGEATRAFLEVLGTTDCVEIVGVADVGGDGVGAARAREMGLRVSRDYRQLLSTADPELIVDASGDPALAGEIRATKPETAEVLGPTSLKLFWELIDEGGEARALREKYNLVLRELRGYSESEFIIGSNPKMKELSELLAKVAPTPTTVLIRGESGTGKELVARAIHHHSALRDRPLVTINCTALSPALLESELFGHRKGAFTGASSDKIGLFEKAHGGTMFLDEVGDMSLETQAKLLRTLQTGEIRAVGDVRTKQVSVRIMAATNRDLEAAIREGRFREDLFYRINTFTLTLPPLRERVEDIPILAEYFLRRASAKVNKRVKWISPQAIALLQNYGWPGNLRELENIIERAVVLTSSVMIDSEHLPLHVQSDVAPVSTGEGFMRERDRAIHGYEKLALSRYLGESLGNVSIAAAKARLPRRTFHRLMQKHGLSSRTYRPLRRDSDGTREETSSSHGVDEIKSSK
ncbi:MAG: sigma 54-interacting transcriptional regulator [Candidatus Binatia bacterium]